MFRSRPPRPSSDLPYWDFISLNAGESFKGWLAGPIVGVNVHYVQGSRACHADITDGRKECGLCKSGVKCVWRGYVPIWDEHGLRTVALIGQNYRHLAMDIRLHGPLKVTKTKRHGSPIRVEPSSWCSGMVALSADDRKPQDLRPWLLRLWKDRELTLWFQDNPEPVPAEPKAHVPTYPDPKFPERVESIKKMLDVRGIPVKPEGGPSLVGDVLDKVLKNGKHAKK